MTERELLITEITTMLTNEPHLDVLRFVHRLIQRITQH